MSLLRIVTGSEHKAHACHLRWFFRYELGLTTGESRTPLRHGSLWDECLAAWYRDNGTSTAQQLYTGVIEPWLEMRREWTSKQERADYLADEDWELAQLTHGMLEGYLAKHQDEFEKWEVVAVKPQVARQVRHPHINEPLVDFVTIDGQEHVRTWASGGEADLLLKNRSDGSYWIMEHKTCINDDWHKLIGDHAFSPQVIRYAWAMADPIQGADCDIAEPVNVTGVIYSLARRKLPAVPEPLQNGRGLSKAKGIDTTHAVYSAAIKKHGLKEAIYADVLEKLKDKTFFMRHERKFKPGEVEAFGVEASHKAWEIYEETQKKYHTRDESQCTGFGTFGCQYRSICKDESPHLRLDFNVKGIRHEELRGAMAENYVAKMRAQ